MPYYTTSQSPIYRQVSIDELISGYVDPNRFQPVRNSPSGTRTIFLREVRREIVSRYNIPGMIRVLREFVAKYAPLYEVPRESLYHHFEIQKSTIDPSTGRYKTRPIDAPVDTLKKCSLRAKGHFGASMRRELSHKCFRLYSASLCGGFDTKTSGQQKLLVSQNGFF